MSDSTLKTAVLLGAFLLGTGAAASAQTPETSTTSPAPESTRQHTTTARLQRSARMVESGTRDVVIISVRDRNTATDVHQFIRKNRPDWLHPRGASLSSSSPEVMVVLNGSPWGDTSMLKELQLNSVTRIQRLSGPDAMTRFGQRYAAGAILINSI